ncbi:MAG: PorT family protein, partial [Bacteroidales bacterium]|nr:PorT family protein [Bacteroidales bacterium]
MIFLCAGIAAFAQEGVGVFGGVTSSSAKLQDFNIDNVTQFRAGIAYKYPVALGFAVQPEFSYSVKGTDLTYALNNEVELSMFNLHMGFVEAALQLQWGPDLLIFRPYALVEPFVGYAFNDRIQTK